MLIRQFRHGATPENLSLAIQDIRRGWRQRELWMTMALNDTRQRYRRSVIGPLWITISMGVFITALALLYAVIFSQELEGYMPYVATGFIIWGLVSSLLVEGGRTFIDNEGMIRQLPGPLSLYAFRMVWSNLIIFLHNMLIFVLIAFWFDVDIGWATLLAAPAVFLVAINGLSMGILLGLVSARFRDVPQIVGSLVQVTFFLTPIIWRPEMLAGRTFVMDWNPVYHLIEIIRAPLLGQVPPTLSIVASILITLASVAMATAFLTVYRWRIAYWV